MHRVQRFLQAAGTLCNPDYPRFHEVRRQMAEASGLSLQNVAWAFDNALEVQPSSWDLEMLCRRTPECERAHVLLSANVFVGALRAIAIGIAAAAEVHVRPSRREPQMVKWLARVAPGQFHVESDLRPAPADHLWAYGRDETMRDLQAQLPLGTIIHEHGHGYGIIVLFEDELKTASALPALVDAIATDTAAFDQRGCLSPRVIVVEAERLMARELCKALATALREREWVIPLGALTDDERAEIVRYRDTLCMAGEVFEAGSGLVSFESELLPWFLPPPGRVLHVKTAANAIEMARNESNQLTTIGVVDTQSERARGLGRAFPGARIAAIGHMQRPKLDGPVDLRHAFTL